MLAVLDTGPLCGVEGAGLLASLVILEGGA